MDATIKRLHGGNIDIDLATPQQDISWQQDACPWNLSEETLGHKCAVKSVSICQYFCGIEYMDTVLCCFPHPNPFKQKA